MKKSILNLILLLVFSTNINANEIIYEKSQSTKELEAIQNWYFNEYLVNQKVQEKLTNNQINNKPKNIQSNNNVDDKSKNIKPNNNVNDNSIERYKLANNLIDKKEMTKAKEILNELCNDKFEIACRKLKTL